MTNIDVVVPAGAAQALGNLGGGLRPLLEQVAHIFLGIESNTRVSV